MIAIPGSLIAYRRPEAKASCDKALAQPRAPGDLTTSQAHAYYAARTLGKRAQIDC